MPASCEMDYRFGGEINRNLSLERVPVGRFGGNNSIIIIIIMIILLDSGHFVLLMRHGKIPLLKRGNGMAFGGP